jgi:hypothetical protein
VPDEATEHGGSAQPPSATTELGAAAPGAVDTVATLTPAVADGAGVPAPKTVRELYEELVRETAANDGRVDAIRLRRLKRLDDLEKFGHRFRPSHKVAFATGCVLLACAVALVLSVLTLRVPRATIDVEASSVRVTTGARTVRSRSLLGESSWAKIASWASIALPNTCPAYPVVNDPAPGQFLRLEPLYPELVASIGLGDDSLVREASNLEYSRGSERSLVLKALDPTPALAFPAAMDPGRLTVLQYVGPPIACNLEGERLDIEANDVEFAPVRTVGPISVARLDFGERILSDEEADTKLSTVSAGTISFPGIPSADVVLGDGDRLDVEPAENGAEMYVRAKGAAVQTIVKGQFAVLRVAGRDVRPSLLEYLSNNRQLRILAATMSAIAALVVWVMQWLGVRQS